MHPSGMYCGKPVHGAVMIFPVNPLPSPGSALAVERGCRCPVLDNRHGLGLYTDEHGKRIFVYDADCPLHGWMAEEEQEDDRSNR